MPDIHAELADVLPGAIAEAGKRIKHNATKWANLFPGDNTIDQFWEIRPPGDGLEVAGANHGWTTSFWTGMFWLAYEWTKDPLLLATAKSQSADFVRRVTAEQDIDTHDLGFLYSLSNVAELRLFPDAEWPRKGAMLAADWLMKRYLPSAGVIQAWGDLTDPAQRGRTIIDSLMNLPLLVWAAEVTGDPKYLDAVRTHSAEIAKRIIRADDSTFHTFYWDPETGEPLRGDTHQGFSDTSCWARGQTWGIYGFTMAYQASGNADLLDAANRVADYYLKALPADSVPYWDLIFNDGSAEERDTSAAAIAYCGLQELAAENEKLGDVKRATQYRDAAAQMLYSLITKYTPSALGRDSDALLLESVYNKPTGHGINEATQFGDYYYAEALMRAANPTWHRYW